MRLNFGKTLAVALAIASPAAFSAAHAQAVGMQVVDTAGAPVGMVTAIKGDNVQIKTDKHEVLLPKASFTVNNGKLLFGLTQAQLDSKVEEAAAAGAKAVAAGATVNGTGGAAVGKIDAVDNGQVTITLTSGKRIQVPSSGLRGNADGTVTIGYTAEQLEALTSGSGTTPAATSPGGSTTGK